jgi:hypothetical protein
MSLGSVLLQPQVLAAAQRPLSERAPNALLDLLTRLAAELANRGPALQIIEEELIATFQELAQEVQPRLDAAKTRLDGLIQPLIDMVQDTMQASGDGGDVFDRLVTNGKAFSDAVATALGGLESARIGEVAGALFDLVETDLGLSEARARTFLSTTVDRIVSRLQAEYLGGASDPAAYNRYALGAAFREVVGLASQELDLPTFNKSTLLPALIERLQALGMDRRIDDAQSAAQKVSAGFESLEVLKSFFPNGAPAPLHAAALRTSPEFAAAPEDAAPADARHCWYASWLKGENVSHPDCTHNPDLEGVDFGDTLTARTMEDFAHVSGAVSCALEAGLHFSSMRQGDFVSNLLNAIWHLVELGLACGNIDAPRGLKWLFAFLASFFGGFERARMHDWYGPLMVLSDMAETQLYARWTWLLREVLLSAFTLSNNKRGLVNHNFLDGIAHLGGELGNFFIALIFAKARKRDFGFPNPSGGSWGRVIGFLLAAIGTSIFMTLVVGTLVSAAISGKVADSERIFRTLLKDRMFFGGATGGLLILETLGTLVAHITDYYIYYFMLADGDTDGGKLTGVGKEALQFNGYPNRADSPYRLPWAKGQLYQAVQGNHGLFSHTPFAVDLEMYAIDFNFDNGDEVLAMRDGIVWDYFENTQDGDRTQHQNEIIILHEDPLGDPNPISGQDFDENNTPTRTFSVYMHASKGSITRAFPPGGPTREKANPGSHTGTKVLRGQVIMFADSTGRSAYNHLHVQIRPMDPTGKDLAHYTIPFVFADDELEGDDGVPRTNKWYDSANVKVT